MTKPAHTKEFYWLSFCDGDKPKGSQFLGAAIVEASDIVEAAHVAWDLGINPGGEVAGVTIPKEFIQPGTVNRLLTKQEAESYVPKA